MIIAILHIVGVLVILAILILVAGLREESKGQRKYRQIVDTASVRLGIPRNSIELGKYELQLAKYLTERYSTERFANRVSDMWQLGLAAVESFSYLCQLSIILGATWWAFTDDFSYARLAWIAVAVAVFSWILVMVCAGVCNLATGRAPGEARDARKIVGRILDS